MPVWKLVALLLCVGLTVVEAVAQVADGPAITHALPGQLLQARFTTPDGGCAGWGSWSTPFVIANGGDLSVQVIKNTIELPAGGVCVHPGAERDVLLGWRSPINDTVSVTLRLADAHSRGGNGVEWMLSQVDEKEQRTIAQGLVDRGCSADYQTPEPITVRAGHGLYLRIGSRNDNRCDSTLVELVITGPDGKQWNLGREVSGNILADNPHGPWTFLSVSRGPVMDVLPIIKAGPLLKDWTISTADTKLTVGATATGQLCVCELSNPATGWNWTKEPSVIVLPPFDWTFKDGARRDGTVTLRYVSAAPELELTSVWWAPPGRGPVRHTMDIVNLSDKSVVLNESPWVDLSLAAKGPLMMWTFHTSGQTPDVTGVYRHTVEPGFERQVRTNPDGEFVPYAVFDADGRHGVYVGIEWGYCRLCAQMQDNTLRVRGGEFAGFHVTLAPGEMFSVPPTLLGSYQGDVSDAGNSLRRYLWAHSMPEVVRRDPTYPKVQWNAFGATGIAPGSWRCTETKYYPFIDDIAPLGFEEVMIDVGWWQEGEAYEPTPHPERWPSGMAKAAEYAQKAGLRFGLYWNKGEAMSRPEGRTQRITHIKRLYEEHKADIWRSDSTGGPVVGGSYAEYQGFYGLLDQLYRELPNFEYENCVCGGRLKDLGSMKRSVKIFLTDTYDEHHVRQAFYDASFIYPPAQLMGCVGSTKGEFRPQGPAGMKFAFRSASLGAPEWFLDSPGGRNGSAPWTDEEKAVVRESVTLYKERIRPLVRTADLYHILPRPNGQDWDGIQYYDPDTGKGVVYLFKPGGPDTMAIKLRGVEPAQRYRVTFADGSNPTVEKTGEELREGLTVTLAGRGVSELIFLDAVNTELAR
ncbi:MAG: alpha-galactosidase [Phycisphaerales bacterium]|nr:alpha-galactosidase [Phycisphaerales bacterium]